MAAVALAVKTRSKCAGSAPRKARVLRRTVSTTVPERWAGVLAEWGFP
jgi:hypothetical protein